MTAAQRATLAQMRLLLGVCDNWRLAETETGRDECGNCGGRLREHQQADALRAALGTCGNCAHRGEGTEAGLIWCAAPMRTRADVTAYPFSYRLMPEGERCTGWTAKEGA